MILPIHFCKKGYRKTLLSTASLLLPPQTGEKEKGFGYLQVQVLILTEMAGGVGRSDTNGVEQV